MEDNETSVEDLDAEELNREFLSCRIVDTVDPFDSKLNFIDKHVMKTQMLEYLDSSNLINPYQTGFRRGYNTTSLLLGLTDSIRKIMDRNDLAVLVALDLSKAFDRVSHSMLIQKLCNFFKFSSTACKLLFSYLSNRYQFVQCGQCCSVCSLVTSGVPQGSVIGPLYFYCI
ncbi:putative RNA-directed DNA polymerase from transposon BS [Lucilia cuprina]|nr:putative RNA-directed DNA polymerase from transposon BS [Lucilia cuprina]